MQAIMMTGQHHPKDNPHDRYKTVDALLDAILAVISELKMTLAGLLAAIGQYTGVKDGCFWYHRLWSCWLGSYKVYEVWFIYWWLLYSKFSGPIVVKRHNCF